MNKEIIFFGLFFLTDDLQNLNFQTNKKNLQTIIYLKCAANLSRCLNSMGYKFILLCNNLVELENIIRNHKIDIKLKEIDFNTYVPKNIHFSSCHYRIDVFNYFSKKKNQISILIDLDILVVNKLPNLNEMFSFDCGYINNISDNYFPAYGEKFVENKLELINSPMSKKWIGGDFFAGNDKFYSLLYKFSKKYQNALVQNREKLTMMTDELFLTAAINEIDTQKLFDIEEVNDLNLFTRYWSVNTRHKQKGLFKIINNNSLIHLPSDKKRISNFYDNNLSIKQSKEAYMKYIKSYRHILYNLVARLTPNFLKKFIKNTINL